MSQTGRAFYGRILMAMIRARNAAKGLVTPPPLHRLMEAVLLLCVSLVQGAVSTLRMIFSKRSRDWHTTTQAEPLPQATNRIHAPTPILRDDCSAIPQDEVGGRSTESRSPHKRITIEALMVSSAHRAPVEPRGRAHSPLHRKRPLGRVPREGGVQTPRNARTRSKSALTRAAQTPAFAGDTVARFARLKSA